MGQDMYFYNILYLRYIVFIWQRNSLMFDNKYAIFIIYEYNNCLD